MRKLLKISSLFLCIAVYSCSADKLSNTPVLNNASDKNTLLTTANNKALLAGASTTFDQSKEAFSHFSPKLAFAEKTKFFVGESFFDQSWITAPSSTEARDGLGPFFNARSCASCHFKDGRGSPPKNGEPMQSLLLRVSVPGKTEHNEPLPSHIYGDQIQGFAIQGLKPEADVNITYQDINGSYPDGESYTLKKPLYNIVNPNYGELEKDLMISPRVAAQMSGMGLLEDITESDILKFADPDDKDNDGISGKANYVWDAENKKVALGRFGWKANQPSVRQQVAGAFSGDIGITSPVFPEEGYSNAQYEIFKNQNVVNGGNPEIIEKNFEKVVVYSRNLSVPSRRNVENPEVVAGEKIFSELSCNKCHITEAKSQGEEIHPYTDLLLHDMGNDLADNRPDFLADGNEWRTPPLWGIGLFKTVNGHTNYMHDGRANNLTEAVLWHGGEANKAKEDFKKLPKSQRYALVKFLESL